MRQTCGTAKVDVERLRPRPCSPQVLLDYSPLAAGCLLPVLVLDSHRWPGPAKTHLAMSPIPKQHDAPPHSANQWQARFYVQRVWSLQDNFQQEIVDTLCRVSFLKLILDSYKNHLAWMVCQEVCAGTQCIIQVTLKLDWTMVATTIWPHAKVEEANAHVQLFTKISCLAS